MDSGVGAAQGGEIGRPSRTVVPARLLAVRFVQHLRRADLEFGPRLARHLERRNGGAVLPEIDHQHIARLQAHVLPVRIAPDHLRHAERVLRRAFHALDDVHFPRREHEVFPQRDLRRRRTQLARELGVAADALQPLHLSPRVIDLAFVYPCRDDRPRVGGKPTLVRADRLRRTVVELQAQFAAKRDLLAELPFPLVAALPVRHLGRRTHHLVAPPSRRDGRGEDVRRAGAAIEQARHVVGIDMAALAAFRHARLEEVVADAPTVGERLEHALRRDGPRRAPDGSSVRKALLKNSSRVVGGRPLLRRDKHRRRRGHRREADAPRPRKRAEPKRPGYPDLHLVSFCHVAIGLIGWVLYHNRIWIRTGNCDFCAFAHSPAANYFTRQRVAMRQVFWPGLGCW